MPFRIRYVLFALSAIIVIKFYFQGLKEKEAAKNQASPNPPKTDLSSDNPKE